MIAGPSTDTTKKRLAPGFVITEPATKMNPWLKEWASQFPVTQEGISNGVNAITTNGEVFVPKLGVESAGDGNFELGVMRLEEMNNKPKEGGHASIDRLIAMSTLQGLKPMTRGGEIMPNYAGGGVIMDQYGHGGMVKDKMMSYQKGGALKPVPQDNPGLGKLPEMVRNKMGYMQDGGMVEDSLMGMRYGGMAKKKKMMGYENGGIVDMVKGLLSRMPMKSESVEDIEQSGAPMVDMEQVSRKKLGMSFDNYGDAIKARNKRLIEDYGSLDSAYDLLRSGEITKDILNRERDAFIQSGNKIGLVGMQEGGPVNQMPEPTADDPLQIDYRMANPEVYQGSTLGVVRQQAGALRDSIDQDTTNKARKALELLKLEGILKGEKVESPGLMPQIPSAADSSRLRDMLEYFKMQTMQNGSRP